MKPSFGCYSRYEAFEVGEIWEKEGRLYKVIDIKPFDYQDGYSKVCTFIAILERINGNERVLGMCHQRIWNETEGYTKTFQLFF